MKTLAQFIDDNPQATDAGVAGLFNAQLPVYRRVPVQEVKDFFKDRLIAVVLRIAKDNPDLPLELRAGIAEQVDTLLNYEYINATIKLNRGPLLAVAAGLAEAGVVTTLQSADFIALLADASVVEIDAAAVATEREMIARRAEVALTTTWLNEVGNPSLADPDFAFVTLADWPATR